MEEFVKRKPNRLSNYDYSQNGAYFITICTYNRKCILSELPLQKTHSTVSNIVGHLKMNSAKEIHKINKDIKVWQRSYYDHIVRNDVDYEEIWNYIENNSLKWKEDRFYCDVM